ncbi:16215_t:CDS:2, partial [Cetraspora pellucida]
TKKEKKSVSKATNVEESLNVTEDYDSDTIINEIDNNKDIAWYSFTDTENLIANCFENSEENGHVRFSEMLKFDDDFINNISSENQESNKEIIYHNIAELLLISIKTGSRYYWEIRKIYSHNKNNQLTGEATVYLGYAQREECKCIHSDSHQVKRVSEARPQIDRYQCGGNIKLNIDINKCQVNIYLEHLIAHTFPTYCDNNLPQNAIAWISHNINKNIRKIEFYKRLHEEKLINPNIHTYQQVYYWVTKFSAQQYVTNISNQLLSARNFLDQNELVDQEYKVLLCIENDFVRSLGFITPFFYYIPTNKITEIILDSTFKTNKEKFELFAVLNNCGGFGVPLTYLYLYTFTALVELLQDPRNKIHSRVLVLKEFFSLLRDKGIRPSFILMDKDAGKLAAIEGAWSQIPKVQICLWHTERAIARKLKEKKFKASQYTLQVANDAKSQFEFIDEFWFSDEQKGVICPEENIKEILKMIKIHASLHPLIPINKGLFLTSAEIYHQSVREAYEYCKNKNLVRLWGYLWFSDEPEISSDVKLTLCSQNELIESRKAELEKDKKMFESLITIVLDNIQNDNFYEVYKKLKRTLVTETIACREALRAKRQQKTWDPPRGSRLAFWLQ